MKQLAIIYFLFLLYPCKSFAQKGKTDSVDFFRDESVIDMKLVTDYRKLRNSKKIDDFQPATVTCRFADSTTITEQIRLCARGRYRRENCYVPSILLDFKNPGSPKLSKLGKLKLVSGCASTSYNEQLLLKEFIIYKIYNLLTEKSYRVRLLKIDYEDPQKKIKEFTQYAFVIEDSKDVAKRNKCRELKKPKIRTEMTDRRQMTLVAIFEYMIGNTDWNVSNGHNIRLIQPKKDSLAFPMAIPYDFDYAGLVDANYAVPSDDIDIKYVTERFYQGYGRTLAELQLVLDVIRQQKDSIYGLIRNFSPLEPSSQKKMISYLDEFYSQVKTERGVKSAFIEKARAN